MWRVSGDSRESDGRAAPLYTTAEMMRMEREIVGHMQQGNQRNYSDPMLVVATVANLDRRSPPLS